MDFKKITEENSNHNNLENKSTIEILNNINYEDQKVAVAVKEEIESIQSLVDDVAERMKNGGRLFYIGAGTSGRLGILDASECPPTFGVADDLVNGIIAGGDSAIRKAVEYAEDDIYKGWEDLKSYNINENDSVIGIAASGTTPYVIGTLDICNKNHILTGGITCNPGSPLDKIAKHAIVPIVGPEFITGSTRMKSGTAQKLILNMISTSLMVKLGKVKGNKMIDMQLSNNKLISRAEKMVMEELNINLEVAKNLISIHESVRKAIDSYK
ncbi:MAG: N-acetylmuramic acid 6-phosphate etherase [Flavobacteriales bacterium]|nr:N-acetylmuramic acid 6-phosphate etherase [Flavobacteriales bacterium]